MAGHERFHSQDPVHLREDLAAALQAALSADQQQVVDVVSITQQINDRHDVYTVLRPLLTDLGPAAFGALALFSIEAQTSLMGYFEGLIRSEFLQEQGVTFAELRWPADVLREQYLDEAAENTPDQRARASAGIRAAVDAYNQQVIKSAHTQGRRGTVDGRIGWLRAEPGDSTCYLVREVAGGWSDDEDDDSAFPAQMWPAAVFAPIIDQATQVVVNRADVEFALSAMSAARHEIEDRDVEARLRAALGDADR